MPSANDIALIHVQLDNAEPAIWRRFAAPVTTTLKGLHDLIQAAMGWQDYHLWEFEIGPHRYGDPDPEYPTNPPTQRAAGVKLAALIARGDLTFSYVYDFGDNWRHTVQVEGVEPAQPHAPYPHFVEGALRCPPEDVGGTPGFEGFLEAVTTPRHPERRTMLDWYGGPFDPKDINRQMIEYRFAQIAKRRMKPGPR
ncbi:plasmid pRiA4b ORF-3 family protein [Brevundimonas aurantiaca]|jgi:hypothetical protein|uniref:plasmid pRiA4b ORF-3 family protein n=1 Tax=Brevundimonas aurantiaca TaxID=74316 RepID=UPI00174C723E|nr:plasmid pRiA4b ORF-3 family protein [Brevundimonas aurantiaca]